MKDFFRKLSARVSTASGSASAFFIAFLVIVVWASTGPLFNFSDTWQLVINTGTTIVTFLMVFLIQNMQNRDSKAMQLKLDELIHSSKSARDTFVDLEDLTDSELLELDEQFKAIHEKNLSTPTLHKLHGKIIQEHKRRNQLATAANEVVNMLNPFSKK